MWLLENFTSHLWLSFYFGGTVLVLRQCSLPSVVLRGQHVFIRSAHLYRRLNGAATWGRLPDPLKRLLTTPFSLSVYSSAVGKSPFMNED